MNLLRNLFAPLTISAALLFAVSAPAAETAQPVKKNRWGARFWTPAGVAMATGSGAVVSVLIGASNQKNAGAWDIVALAHLVGFGVSATWAIVNAVKAPPVTVSVGVAPQGVVVAGRF